MRDETRAALDPVITELVGPARLYLETDPMSPPAARTLVESLCRDGDVVVFSAGTDHWPSYWAKRFAEHGYEPYDLLRDAIWWDQRIEWEHRQNVLVFAPGKVARKHRWRPPQRSLDLAQPAFLMPELRKPLRATVCIPWRPTPSRLKAFARVQSFWAMFGWPVITADSDTKIFSLAQARNNAVEQAATDVVVVSDADTLVDPLNVLRAVAEPRGICWPFDQYHVLSPEYVDTPLPELANMPDVNTWRGAGVVGVGGCMVCTTREFWRLGGQPPEFVGWGWEDTCFAMIVRTLSTVRRFHGHVYSFEHNEHGGNYIGAKADSPGWDRDISRNEHLFSYYRAGDGRAWLMRELIAQRDTPGSTDASG